jgi:hypothetical protein
LQALLGRLFTHPPVALGFPDAMLMRIRAAARPALAFVVAILIAACNSGGGNGGY